VAPAQTFIIYRQIYRQNPCSHKNLIEELVLTVIWELDAGSKRQQFNFVLSSCLRQNGDAYQEKLLTEEVVHAGS